MVDFLATNLPILLCLLAGMALVTLEALLPGFGIPGISGIILLVVGIGITITQHGMLVGLGVLIIIIAILALVISIALKSVARGKLSKSGLVLKDTVVDAQQEEAEADMQTFVGHVGRTSTVLRPAGIADFDGVRFNVVTEGEFVEKDEEVTIIRVEGSRIVVRRLFAGDV